MSCIGSYDFCIIRGDTFKLDVGLSSSWEEVISNPTSWVGNLVFREFQDDDLTPYLSLSAAPEVDPDPLPTDPPLYLRFSADTTQTQALPDWSHVAYCEVTDGTTVTRLFNSDVEVQD